MKYIQIIACLFLLSPHLLASSVERGNVPRGIYLEDQLEIAQKKASEDGKPLTFVFSQRNMKPV